MFQDALYVYLGLTGCHCQEIPLRLKRFQHLRNTIIDLIFKKSRILKALSVFCHSFFCLFGGETVEFHKAVTQWRSDKRLQLVQIRLLDAKGVQCILHTGSNSDFRICQGAVQIKQQIFLHSYNSFFFLFLYVPQMIRSYGSCLRHPRCFSMP